MPSPEATQEPRLQPRTAPSADGIQLLTTIMVAPVVTRFPACLLRQGPSQTLSGWGGQIFSLENLNIVQYSEQSLE